MRKTFALLNNRLSLPSAQIYSIRFVELGHTSAYFKSDVEVQQPVFGRRKRCWNEDSPKSDLSTVTKYDQNHTKNLELKTAPKFQLAFYQPISEAS